MPKVEQHIPVESILEHIQPTHEAGVCFLSVYNKSQAYGGCEEGGWWYDVWEFKGARMYPNRQEAALALSSLQDWLAEQVKRDRAEHAKAYAALPDPDVDPLPSESYYPEGYIPRGWSDGGQTYLMIEDEAGQHQSRGAPPTWDG